MRTLTPSLESVFAQREALLWEISSIRERRRLAFQQDVDAINLEYDRQVSQARKVGAIRSAAIACLVAAFYGTFFAWTVVIAYL